MRRLSLLLVAAALAACSGSGGSAATEPPTEPPPPVAGLRCSGVNQTGWCWQNPQLWAPVIHDVQFTDARNGWAVGDALLRTRDGGATWQEQPLPGGTAALAIRFSNDQEGWLLSQRAGRLWHTLDGGLSWNTKNTLSVDYASSLELGGSRSLLVKGVQIDGAAIPIKVTAFSNDAASTWRVASTYTHLEGDGTLWAYTDVPTGAGGNLGAAGNYHVLSTDGGHSFSLPAAWGGRAYTPTFLESGSVTAAESAVEFPLTRDAVPVLQRTGFGTAWSPVTLPPAPDGAFLESSDLAIFLDGSWASTWNSGPLGVREQVTLWRRGASASDWLPVQVPGGATFVDPHGFADGRTAWFQARDQAPTLTTDGGGTWVSGLALADDPAASVSFIRRDATGALLLAYAGGTDIRTPQAWHRSTDDGRSWLSIPGSAGTVERITGLWFFDAQRGIAATSQGQLLDTGNGGREWTPRAAPSALRGELVDLHFTPSGTGWVVGLLLQPALWPGGPRQAAQGSIFQSLDGGRSWRALDLPATLAGRVLHLQFVDDRHGFMRAVTGCTTSIRGGSISCEDQLHTTDDAGLTWHSAGVTQYSSELLQMSSALQGLRVSPGGGDISTTDDGGRTWTPRARFSSGDSTFFPGVVPWPTQVVTTADATWLLANTGLQRSTDRGRTWTTVSLPIEEELRPDARLAFSNLLRGIAFADARNGWIVGRDGLVLATTDGGITWTRQPTGTQQTLLTVRALSATQTWIGGTARTILSTTNGGR